MKRRRAIDWFLATRPWAFSASVIPIVAGAAWLGCRCGDCDWINVILSLFVLLFLHAGTDVLSDCQDHEKGVDFPGSPNGVTWIRNGMFCVSELRRFGTALLGVGTLLGLVVVWRSSWSVLWIGVAGVAIAFGYSFLKYRALGDVAVFLGFTVLPAAGIGMVAVNCWVPETLLVAAPPGLLTMSILNANNMRDVVSDAKAGCRTLPMVLGRPTARAIYLAQTLLPFALVGAFVFAGFLPYAAVVTFLTLPLALQNVWAAYHDELATLDRASAQLQLVFGALFAVSLPVGVLGFWWQISLASVLTGALAVCLSPRIVCRNLAVEVVTGVVIAAALWGVFWVGNFFSRQIFGFADEQIGAIYALKSGHSPIVLAALLLLLIGPAEELFWRGLVQRRMSERFGANVGCLAATACYVLMHIWSMNFMLIGAAAVCGVCWGAFYRFFPKHLPALVLSHALWDASVFVLFPIVGT